MEGSQPSCSENTSSRIVASTKEGMATRAVVTTWMILSVKESRRIAAREPRNTPSTRAIAPAVKPMRAE